MCRSRDLSLERKYIFKKNCIPRFDYNINRCIGKIKINNKETMDITIKEITNKDRINNFWIDFISLRFRNNNLS